MTRRYPRILKSMSNILKIRLTDKLPFRCLIEDFIFGTILPMVRDNKVSDCQYDLGVKGQGQIYLFIYIY